MSAREAGSVDGILFDGGSRPCYWEEGHAWSASKKDVFEKKVVTLKTDGKELCKLNLDVYSTMTEVPIEKELICWSKHYKKTETYEVFIRDIAKKEMSEKEIMWEHNGVPEHKATLPPIYGAIKTRMQLNNNVHLASVKKVQTVTGVKPNSSVAFYLCMSGLEKSAMAKFRLFVNGKRSKINTRLEVKKETCLLTKFRSSPPGRSTLVKFEFEEIGVCYRSGSYMIRIDGKYKKDLTGDGVSTGVLEDGSSGNAGEGVVARKNTTTRYKVIRGVFGDYQDQGDYQDSGREREIQEIKYFGSSPEMSRVSTSLLGTVVVLAAGFCL